VATVIDTAAPPAPLIRPRVRFLRYVGASAVATALSAGVFAAGYRFMGLGPQITSVAAFLAGAVVNFTASRFWAWGRRRLPGWRREALSYGLISVVIALAATGMTTLTEWYALQLGVTANLRAVLVEGSYFATYSVMFLGKFLVLDRIVFNRPA
jgi:putative flippase GtrA